MDGQVYGLLLKHVYFESISPGGENLILEFLLQHNLFFFFLSLMRKLDIQGSRVTQEGLLIKMTVGLVKLLESFLQSTRT